MFINEFENTIDVAPVNSIEVTNDVLEEPTLYYIWRESDNRYLTCSNKKPEHNCWTLAKPIRACAPLFPCWDSRQQQWYLKLFR